MKKECRNREEKVEIIKHPLKVMKRNGWRWGEKVFRMGILEDAIKEGMPSTIDNMLGDCVGRLKVAREFEDYLEEKIVDPIREEVGTEIVDKVLEHIENYLDTHRQDQDLGDGFMRRRYMEIAMKITALDYIERKKIKSFEEWQGLSKKQIKMRSESRFPHVSGDEHCGACFFGYPKRCKCGGLIHAEFKSYNGDNVELITKCDGNWEDTLDAGSFRMRMDKLEEDKK